MDTTNDSSWDPDPDLEAMTIGVANADGFHPAGMGRRHNGRNRLLDSPNPIVRSIGTFCMATPTDMDNGMSTFGGFLVGMRMAMLHPDLVEDVFRDIIDIRRDVDSPTPDVLDSTVRSIIDGQ